MLACAARSGQAACVTCPALHTWVNTASTHIAMHKPMYCPAAGAHKHGTWKRCATKKVSSPGLAGFEGCSATASKIACACGSFSSMHAKLAYAKMHPPQCLEHPPLLASTHCCLGPTPEKGRYRGCPDGTTSSWVAGQCCCLQRVHVQHRSANVQRHENMPSFMGSDPTPAPRGHSEPGAPSSALPVQTNGKSVASSALLQKECHRAHWGMSGMAAEQNLCAC